MHSHQKTTARSGLRVVSVPCATGLLRMKVQATNVQLGSSSSNRWHGLQNSSMPLPLYHWEYHDHGNGGRRAQLSQYVRGVAPPLYPR